MRARFANDAVRGFLWWLPGCLIFFRNAITTGFDRIIGDDVDSRFTVFIYEHWVQVAKGDVSWTSPQIFYPTKGTLAYSDTYVLNEVFYLPLRAVGCDPWLAFQLTIMVLSLVGFVALFVFLRRTLALGAPTCAALATTFAFANNLYNVAGHTQLYAVYWLPVLLLILLQVSTAHDRRSRIAWGAAAGGFLGLLFYSFYYTAWFAALALTSFAAVVLVWRLATRGRVAVAQMFRGHLFTAVSAAVAFGLAMIPFLITYLPALRLFPARPYAETMQLAAWPSDVINLGPNNVVWSTALRRMIDPQRLVFGEVWLAVTPVLMLTALAGCLVILARRRTVAVGFTGEACAAATIVLAFLTVLPMKFGSLSLWAFAKAFIPGAGALRAIDRIAIVCGLIAVLVVALAIRSMRAMATERFHSQQIAAALLALVLGLILVEQINVGNGQQVHRSAQLKELHVAPPPPAACRAFYVIDSGRGFYVRNTTEAMQIAQYFGIPTLNGYSGQFPPGSDFLNTNGVHYLERVHKWADEHGVSEGLCTYDRYVHVWAGPET